MKKILYFLAIAVFSGVVILPIGTIVLSSFIHEGGLSFHKYFEIVYSQTLWLLVKSASLACTVAIFSTFLGGWLAFFLTKTNFPHKDYFKLLLLIPLFLSPYILAVSWVDFFILIGKGKSFIYSSTGVIFVLTLIFSPLSMLIIASGLANISSTFEEAGLMITTYSKVLRNIVIPLLKPAILSSFVLVFIMTLSEFSVPAFLSVDVYTTEIFTQFSAFYNYDLAVAHSMVLILICVFLLLIEGSFLADAPFIAVGVKSHQSKLIELEKSKLVIGLVLLIYVFISVVIPIMVLFYQSLKGGWNTLSKAIILLSPTIFDSLLYAVIGASFLTAFGFVFAYLSEREKVRLVNHVLLITFAIPSTVLGISLIKFFNRPSLGALYSSFWMIIMAYLGRFIFIAEKLIANALKQIPVSFEEAAHIVGANFLLCLRKIVLPLISNGLFAAFFISFIFCLGELGATILVYPPGTSLMPVKVYTIMANAPQSLTSAMSLIVLVITLLSLSLLFAGRRVWVIQNRS